MKKIRTIIISVVSVAVLAVLSAVLVSGSASAHSRLLPGTSTGKTVAVPNLNNGESATFRVIDTGRSIIVLGSGSGMSGAKSYVSLLYPDNACSKPEPTAGLTLGGARQNRGDNRQSLFEQYDGAAYTAVKGKIGSVSIREVTAATNAGAGNFTLTATARACAPLNAQR